MTEESKSLDFLIGQEEQEEVKDFRTCSDITMFVDFISILNELEGGFKRYKLECFYLTDDSIKDKHKILDSMWDDDDGEYSSRLTTQYFKDTNDIHKIFIDDEVVWVAEIKSSFVYLESKDSVDNIMALKGNFIELTDIFFFENGHTGDMTYRCNNYVNKGNQDTFRIRVRRDYFDVNFSFIGQIVSIKHKSVFGNDIGYAHIVVLWRDKKGVAHSLDVLGDILFVPAFKQMIANSDEIIKTGGLVRLNGLEKKEVWESQWYLTKMPTKIDSK